MVRKGVRDVRTFVMSRSVHVDIYSLSNEFSGLVLELGTILRPYALGNLKVMLNNRIWFAGEA